MSDENSLLPTPTPTPTSSINDSIHSYQSTSNFHFGGLTSITTPTIQDILNTTYNKVTN